MASKVYMYTVIFEPAEEGGFTVTCPALPGVVTEGDTLDEARERAKEGIAGYIEYLVERGLPVPPPAVAARHEEQLEVIVRAS